MWKSVPQRPTARIFSRTSRGPIAARDITDLHTRHVVQHGGAHAAAPLRPGPHAPLIGHPFDPPMSRSSQLEPLSLPEPVQLCPAYNETDCSAQTWNSRWRVRSACAWTSPLATAMT